MNFTGACGMAAHQAKDFILIGEPFLVKTDLAAKKAPKLPRADAFSVPWAGN